jgi:hypothetical protein
MKKNTPITSLVEDIRPLIEAQKHLARKAESQYSVQIDDIIRQHCRDGEHIAHLLDSMLGFCFDERMLLLFKKLCRYYYAIDPVATTEYVYTYRDMWDDDYAEKVDDINGDE